MTQETPAGPTDGDPAAPAAPPGSPTRSGLARTLGPRIWGHVRIARPLNSIMAATGVAVGLLAANARGWPIALAAMLSAILVAQAGNILNDLLDRQLDAKAHPRRPLVRGAVSQTAARRQLVLTLAAGIACAAYVGWAVAAFAVANVLLLAAYELRLKAQGLAGNAAVALLVASTIPFGALAAGRAPDWTLVLSIAAMAFLSTVAREIVKDIEDRRHDAGHRNTLPMRIGVRRAHGVAGAATVLAVVASTLLLARPPTAWWPPWLPILLLADLLHVVAAGVAGARPARGQRLLKVAMAVALLAFVLGPLVPRLLDPSP